MIDILQYVLYLLLTLGILVTFHEFGHFLVARLSGVHVVRFVIGYGRPIVGFKDRFGTEFGLAAFPLGGYVSMYDENDAEEPDPRLSERSYHRLSPYWRIAIALGGPIANFILAFLVYWMLFAVGITARVPTIDRVDVETPAYSAGLRGGEEIIGVDGRDTQTWSDVTFALARRLGDTGDLDIAVRDSRATTDRVVSIPIERWHAGVDDPDILGSIGIAPGEPAVIDGVVEGGAADAAGFSAGDVILRVNGSSSPYLGEFLAAVRASPEITMTVDVERSGREQTIYVTPASREGPSGEMIGRIGASMAIQVREVEYPIFESMIRAVDETRAKTMVTLELLKKMVFGDVSVKNLSGPITIAKVAGDSARAGVATFASLLALLSISLGIINLLPIPILDGGHVIFGIAEIVRRKPLSIRAQTVGVQVGLCIVVGMMVLAFYNDITRWF